MNISDAAREAVYPICDACNVSTYKNREGVERIVQSAINTATAALTLELEKLRQQLAEAREDTKRLDLAEKYGASITFAMTPDMGGYNWLLYLSGHPRQKKDRTIRQALDRIHTLNPPTDEK